MSDAPLTSEATVSTIRSHAAALASAASDRVESQFAWFGALSAEDRSWIGVIAHSGIQAFLDWLSEPTTERAAAVDIFADAPRELTRKISLEQTLDLIRAVIEVVEDQAPRYVAHGEESAIRTAVLHYSREVAFAAARVYARAAESRGAWDARLESLVVDALVRGEPDESLGSRVNALGWSDVSDVCVVVGSSPMAQDSGVVDPLRRAARHAGLELLVSVAGRRMIVVLGQVAGDPLEATAHLVDHFGPGPIVCGPVVPHLYAAGRSARDAIRGFHAAPAAPWAPRPVRSSDLIAARAVAGDEMARRQLARLAREHLPASSALGETARAFLRRGSLEATARELYVHANTVRYRLGKITDATGYDITLPDEAFALRVAIMLSDLGESVSRPPRPRDTL